MLPGRIDERQTATGVAEFEKDQTAPVFYVESNIHSLIFCNYKYNELSPQLSFFFTSNALRCALFPLLPHFSPVFAQKRCVAILNNTPETVYEKTLCGNLKH